MRNWFARPTIGRYTLVAAVAVAGGTLAAPASASPAPATAADPVAATNLNNNPRPPCESITTFDRKNFTNPTKIDNRFLPLVPGTQYVLEGTASTGGGGTVRRIVLTVTDLTKVIDGVKTVVMLDKDFNDGVVAEAELAFQAQDRDGRVWNMGEYPELYEDGKFVGAPDTWIAGLSGAEPGQHMLDKPKVGIRTYLQGFVPSIDFLDCGRIIKTGQRLTVSGKTYNDVLVVKETSPPDTAAQLKYYAPGVGNIRVEPVNDPEAELLDLVRVVKLGPGGMSIIRDKALELEKRAYKVSNVYKKTPPMQRA